MWAMEDRVWLAELYVLIALGPRESQIGALVVGILAQERLNLHSYQVNTASCLGLVKAMFCDSLLGKHPNLFLVAAANPYREEASAEDLVVRGSRTVMRDFFQALVQHEPNTSMSKWAFLIGSLADFVPCTNSFCSLRSLPGASSSALF